MRVTYIQTIFLLAFAALSTHASAFGVRAGVGFSTVTSGRQIPALELGLRFNDDWAASAMMAGVRTRTYYTSGIMANVMRVNDWGEFLFGRLEVGFGGGVYHGEKGIYTSVDDDGKPTNLRKDTDNVFGPAFRVAFSPVSHVHFSIEYLMGFGSSLISHAWEDVGMGAIGVDL